jgi:hypothetical protein
MHNTDEAVRGSSQVVDKSHHAMSSRLLVAIGQPFREQSVTPEAEPGALPGLSADVVWPSPSEQSPPGTLRTPSALRRQQRHCGVLSVVCTTEDGNLSVANTATGSFATVHCASANE